MNEDLIFRLNPNRALSPDTRLDVGCFDTTCALTLSAKGAPLVVQAARDGVSPRVEAYDDVGIALHIIADLAGNSLPGIRTFVFVLADPSGTSELRLTCRRDTLIASRNTQTPSNAQTRAAYLLGEARFANRLCYRQEWLTAT